MTENYHFDIKNRLFVVCHNAIKIKGFVAFLWILRLNYFQSIPCLKITQELMRKICLNQLHCCW